LWTTTVKSRAYGIIPVVLKPNGGLLISHAARLLKNWDFPKRGSDQGEEPIQTALRVLREDADIIDTKLEWGGGD